MIDAAKRAWSAASTGRCLTRVLAGSLPRKLSPFQFLAGLIGLGTNPPPQFGHTFCRMPSTHAAQNVHSYVHIRASSEAGGRDLLQFSHVGRSSSIGQPLAARGSHHLPPYTARSMMTNSRNRYSQTMWKKDDAINAATVMQ